MVNHAWAASLFSLIIILSVQLTTAVSLDLGHTKFDLNLANVTSAQMLLDEYSQHSLPPPADSPILMDEVREKLSPRWSFNLGRRQSCPQVTCFTGTCSSCQICCAGNGTGGCGPGTGTCCGNGYCAAGSTCCNANSCCGAGSACCNNACCQAGQTCDPTNGCTWPTVTVTATATSLATQYETVTTVQPNVQIITETDTVYSTFFVTVTNVATATEIDSTTTLTVEKRAWSSFQIVKAATGLTATTTLASGIDVQSEAPRPTLRLMISPNLDSLQRKLEEIGILVKRQGTMTDTVYVTVPATTTVFVYTTSVEDETSTVTVTTQAVITSTVFAGAETTIDVVETITMTSSAAPTAGQAQNGGGSQGSGGGATPAAQNQNGVNTPNSGGGLTTGAEVGIGVGTAGGSLIICIILFWLCRRRRRQEPAPQFAAAETEQAVVVKSPNESQISPTTSSTPFLDQTGYPIPVAPIRPNQPNHQAYPYNYTPPIGQHGSGSTSLSQLHSADHSGTPPNPGYYQGRPVSPQVMPSGAPQAHYQHVRPMSPQEMSAIYSNSPRFHEMPIGQSPPAHPQPYQPYQPRYQQR